MTTIDLTADFPIGAEKLYKAWLTPVHHAAMSYGGDAVIDAQEGGSFSLGDDYIAGRFLELVPGRKIVETWRTTDFAPDQADTQVELTFTDTENGCTLHLVQTGLPDDQVESYRSGWVEFYFNPMKLYFGG
jgi:activator of HSP90 ATPase